MSENKRKGGAQKVREKNKKLLSSQAKQCRPISEQFSIPLIQKVSTYIIKMVPNNLV